MGAHAERRKLLAELPFENIPQSPSEHLALAWSRLAGYATDPELFMLHVWEEMYKKGLTKPFFCTLNGMRRCIDEATRSPPEKRAINIYETLLARTAKKRLTS